MRSRVQVSTDVAALGIWDPNQPSHPGFPVLERLAQQGEAAIIRMGGDCSGAVEIFIDEEIPAELLSESSLLAGERSLVVRSGEVFIDGVEYFGAGDKTLSRTSSVRVPNGVYRTTIRITTSEDKLPEPKSEKELRRMIGADEVAYYDRTNRSVLLIGLSTLLILPLLLIFTRWFIALPVTLAVFIAYFHVQRWFLSRNPRYQKLAQQITPRRLAGERPIVVIQLSKRTDK